MSYVKNMFKFLWDVITGIFVMFRHDKKYMKKIFTEQLYFFGTFCFPIVFIVSFFVSLVLTLQLVNELGKFGAQSMTGAMVMVAFSREIAPILVAIIVSARMGSAMAAEIGSMNINDQIDSLKLMGLNPVQYLVSPRVLAGIILLPFLTAIAIFFGGIASYIMAVKIYGISWGAYLDRVAIMMKPYDFFGGILKTPIFGFIVPFISCYFGISLKGSSNEVGKATTDAVAYSIVIVIAINLIFSYILFG